MSEFTGNSHKILKKVSKHINRNVPAASHHNSLASSLKPIAGSQQQQRHLCAAAHGTPGASTGSLTQASSCLQTGTSIAGQQCNSWQSSWQVWNMLEIWTTVGKICHSGSFTWGAKGEENPSSNKGCALKCGTSLPGSLGILGYAMFFVESKRTEIFLLKHQMLLIFL